MSALTTALSPMTRGPSAMISPSKRPFNSKRELKESVPLNSTSSERMAPEPLGFVVFTSSINFFVLATEFVMDFYLMDYQICSMVKQRTLIELRLHTNVQKELINSEKKQV